MTDSSARQEPEYVRCGPCGHIEPEHRPDAGPCLICGCSSYAPESATPGLTPYRRLLARLGADRAGHMRAAGQTTDETLRNAGSSYAAALHHAAVAAVVEFEGAEAAQEYAQRTSGGEAGEGDEGLRERMVDGQGDPAELRDLPSEVRHLVHAVDRMRGDWAESSEKRRVELWRGLHEASDAVWNRPLAVLPAPADRAAVLTETERSMFRFALEMAQEEIHARSLEFSANDRAALTSLRRLADEAQQAEPRCTCADAGPEFAPAGHYPDCPQAQQAQQAQQAGEAR